jgi:hypothetical protein
MSIQTTGKGKDKFASSSSFVLKKGNSAKIILHKYIDITAFHLFTRIQTGGKKWDRLQS